MTQETEFDRLLADKHISQAALQHKTDWVFDLDNTIYPAASSLFPRVAERMTLFICEELGLNTEDAAARAAASSVFRPSSSQINRVIRSATRGNRLEAAG